MDKLLSVVIPFYCTPDNLFTRCIDSILRDSFTNIEILVIDDGSPEDKKSALHLYENDPRVRVLYSPHAGVSAARNRGIREAKGDWIAFVDSDDYLERDTFDRIVSGLDSFDGDVIIFNGGADNDGKIIHNTCFLKENVNYGGKRELKLQLMESALTVGKMPSGYVQRFSLGSVYCKLLNREFLIKNKIYFDETLKFAEDTLFSLNLFYCAEKIFYHDWFFYYYVDNSQSVTRKFRPGLSRDTDCFFEKTKSFIAAHGLEKELNTAYLCRAQFEAGRCFFREFFNPLNKDKDAKKKYREFIGKEPYKSGLEQDTLSKESTTKALFYFLVKKGYGKVYLFMKKCASALHVKS